MYVHKAWIVQDIASFLQELYISLSTPTPTFRDAQICKELHLGYFSCDHVERIRRSIIQRVLLSDSGEIYILIVLVCEFGFHRYIGLDVLQGLDRVIVRVISIREVIAQEIDEEEELKLCYMEFR